MAETFEDTIGCDMCGAHREDPCDCFNPQRARPELVRGTAAEYVSIRVLATQLAALRALFASVEGKELTDDELYSAAAIAVLLYSPPTDQ